MYGEAVFCLLVLVLSWLAVGSGRSGRVCLRIQCDDSALYLARLGATFAFILRLLQGRLSQGEDVWLNRGGIQCDFLWLRLRG